MLAKEGTYSVLLMTDEKVKELFRVDYEILYPQYYGDNNVVFIKKDKTDNAYLYKYNIKDKTVNLMIKELVDAESRPILKDDGGILITIKNKDMNIEQEQASTYIITEITEKKEMKQIKKG